MATLESECGLEVRQVRRHIDRLEAHCLIKVKRSRKRDADGQVRNSLNEISLLPLEIRYKTPWEPFNGDLTENEQSQVRPYKSCDSREKKEDAFGKLPYTILYGTTLKDISKRLYPYLMARLGNHEYCKTNYKEIADHLGVTDSTVKLGLAELKAQGQIHVKRINHGIEINKS